MSQRDLSSQGKRSPSNLSGSPSSPPKRKKCAFLPDPSSPPRFPYLPKGSLIIRGFAFPREIYYKTEDNYFWELVLHYDAVLNYERKIVAVFLETCDIELHGLYYGKGGTRIKITPHCLEKGHIREHIDELDNAGYHYYPEFHDFHRTDEIVIESLEAYKILGRGLSCSHTPESQKWYFDLPPEARIVAGVQFPPGFFFRIEQKGLFHPLALHDCDAVVDSSKKIVAVFLGRYEHRLLAIYIEEGGQRVKLSEVSMKAEHFEYMNRAESKSYQEFSLYKKPPEIYRTSLAACG